MSIRLRLTLLYSTILAFTLIASSALLYVSVSRLTLGVIEGTLRDESQRLIRSGRFQLDSIEHRAAKFGSPETYIQTIDLDGEVAYRTSSLGTFVLPLSETGRRTCLNGRPWTEIVPVENGRLLVYSTPVAMQGRPVGIVQVARSLAEFDQLLGTVKRVLVAGGSLVIVLACVVGWVLAGAALGPINRITRTAQAIGAARDFDQRVDYSGPPDEIGRLATTLNTMLTQLQTAYRQVEQSLVAQRRFVADASHELRTPLTTIRGNLGLLLHEPPISDEDRKAVLADMVEECERLMRLTNDLLVLARADAGRHPSVEPVALAPLLQELCRQAHVLGPDKRITCDDGPDVTVLANSDVVKQVLLILLDNAVKFTPPGGTITIGARAGEGQASISVSDTGPGIDASLLPHIFERFWRGNVARSGAGTGLGLAIAKELVEAQGGAITIQSQVGRGSTFTVSLPLAAITSGRVE
ncbi:MAG TPA: ATP-binding protein [Ardenticatenaceae bacterium]|nr:ATP-binding protein [Ardenticatenaceae bacterium]